MRTCAGFGYGLPELYNQAVGEDIPNHSRRNRAEVANLGNEIIASIEACGHVGRAEFDRLCATYSVSGRELSDEIDRILDADPHLAAKHRLALEVAARARAREDESLAWLNDYRERAVALGWKRADLVALASAEIESRDKAGEEAEPQRQPVAADRDDSDRISPPLQKEKSSDPGGTRKAGGGRGGDANGSDRPSATRSEGGDGGGDEFPIQRTFLIVTAVLVLFVFGATAFFGDDAPRVNPAEQSAWQRAENRGSVRGYQTFIQQWPNSSRVEEARDRLASLAERRAAARRQAARERKTLIRQAQQYLSILGYDVDATGEMDEATRQAIAAFEQLRGLPQRDIADPGLLSALEDAWRAAEEDVWRQAQAEGTIAAVTRYLEAYPEARYAAAARERIEQLQTAAERRELIESIQDELVRLGRDVDVSGTLDARTTSEIRDYRVSKGQPKDAPVDASLLIALRDLERWPPQPGETFIDCPRCPPMVVIPEGEFMMGSPPDELMRVPNEGPQHRVSISRFALARTEVTFEQYRHCVEADACSYLPRDEGWGQGDRPVINVSMEDAGAYVRWLSDVTGRRYRLPSEAEWEYAARGGTTTRFYTGNCLSAQQANFDARRPASDCPEGNRLGKTLPVASFPPNPFGLYDMHGNVREWTLDCWNPDYTGAPDDGSAWIEGDCSRAVLRGGAWRNAEGRLRSASRTRPSGAFHNDHTGFRPAVSVGSSVESPRTEKTQRVILD